jgi:Ca2+:H+ antiporter
MKSGLLASGLLPALIPNPGIANDFQGSNEYRSLKELRDATQKPCSKEDKPRYPAYLDILILICSLVMLVFASIYVLEAIEAPSRSMNLSKSFVGLVVMPSIIASVDHIAATLRSHKEGIAWIIEIAFGSSVRISLFVFPIAVIVGWFLGVSDMNMILDGFQVIVLCLTIFLVNHVIHNGFLHW